MIPGSSFAQTMTEFPMLHTKFGGNRPAGSGEDFEWFLPYMGVAAILVM